MTQQDFPFHLGQRISEGAFASIFLCRDRKATNAELFAVKLIDKAGIVRSGRQTSKQIDGEVTLHGLCGSSRNANILDFFTSGETSLGVIWICMEFASGGDLFDKIEPDLGLPEEIAHLYFCQLLAGLSFIHSKGVSHRDIKPENILLDGNGRLKIADFGLAALYQYQGKRRLLKTCCGSPPYVAPEIVSSYDGEKVDVWSAGVVLFAMLLGTTPWNEPTAQCSLFRQFARSRGTPQYEPWVSLGPAVYDLLQNMLIIDPDERYSLEQVNQHAWTCAPRAGSDPITLANTLMSRLQVDLSQPPPSTQLRPQSQNARSFLTQQLDKLTAEASDLRASQNPIVLRSVVDVMEDDPALSQYTGSTQILDSLTQKARRFADITGSERLTRFFSLWSIAEIQALLVSALSTLGIQHQVPSEKMIPIVAIDTTDCQMVGYFDLYRLQNDMVVADFTKQIGDPQQWRRLFKVIAYSVRECIYTGR